MIDMIQLQSLERYRILGKRLIYLEKTCNREVEEALKPSPWL